MGTHKSSKEAKSKDSSRRPKEGKEARRSKDRKAKGGRGKEPQGEARPEAAQAQKRPREEPPAAEERAEKATRGRDNGAPRAAKPKGRPKEGAPRDKSREAEAPEADGAARSDDPADRSAKRAKGGEAEGAERAQGAGGGSGFSRPLAPPPAPPPPTIEVRATAISAPGSATQLAVLPEKVRGLLDNRDSLAHEVLRMKQAMEALPSLSAASREAKEEVSETTLRMPPRLHESLLHPDNESQLLARTGLAAVALNEEGLVILRAHTRKGLAKALSQLRRVAYHCQWGCSKTKVAALLADKPAKPAHSMVVRLAATSSRLHSHEARLTPKARKLRVGTQASACQLVIEGIPGLSRRHCTITFEPEKGAVYLQDLSTNGTYLNGKRLPRPPYKNPQDARVRLFHGDEMFFRLRSDDTEELGYVVNLFELG